MPNGGSAGGAGGAFHGRDRFDPVLIISQIVLLQACFYTSYVRPEITIQHKLLVAQSKTDL